jgi:GH25 family lysozyme M1 (1,4-beta-N-acetylmuramidase)
VTGRFDQPTWTRRVLRHPADDDWALWQWGWFSSVDGTDGGVDMNVARPDCLSTPTPAP